MSAYISIDPWKITLLMHDPKKEKRKRKFWTSNVNVISLFLVLANCTLNDFRSIDRWSFSVEEEILDSSLKNNFSKDYTWVFVERRHDKKHTKYFSERRYVFKPPYATYIRFDVNVVRMSITKFWRLDGRASDVISVEKRFYDTWKGGRRKMDNQRWVAEWVFKFASPSCLI